MKGKTHKKYRAYTRSRRIFIMLAIVSCAFPLVYSGISIFLTRDANGTIILGGGMLLLLGALFFLLNTVIKSGSSRLPITLSIFISVVLTFIIVLGLKIFVDGTIREALISESGYAAKVISKIKLAVEDAFSYLILQTIGAAVGVVLELAAKYCKAMLEEIKVFYGEDENNGTTS